MKMYETREEIANVITHAIGVVLSVVGLAALVITSAMKGDPWQIVSFTIYGSCMLTLYLASTFYHTFQSPRVKHVLRIFDHCAIYLMIAGTYTPFALLNMRGPWGWTLFIIIWALAIGGIAYKMFFVNKYRLISVLIYILMGWLVCIAVKPMFQMIPLAGIIWIAIGGIAYTAGTAFYASSFAMSHMIWHLFVLAGSICHYIAIYFYVL